MKEETKNLIVWIKKQINLAKETCINPCHKDGYPEYEADYEKAMNFLDSLPEIEQRLCFGGYIQDKNGTPCCHGDKVLYNGKKGKLAWSLFNHNFHINMEDGDMIIRFARNDIEKVVEKDGR